MLFNGVSTKCSLEDKPAGRPIGITRFDQLLEPLKQGTLSACGILRFQK